MLRDALSYLDPGCSRDDWRNVIAGIHAASGSVDLADDWSRGALDRQSRYKDQPPANYVDRDDVAKVYDTMVPKAGDIGVGTLIHEAKEAGWKGNPFGSGKTPAETFAGALIPIAKMEITPPQHLVKNPWFPDVNQYGVPKPTTANCRTALEAIGVDCRFDSFRHLFVVGGKPLNDWVGEMSDEIIERLCKLCKDGFQFEPEPKKMKLAIQQIGYEHKFNPVTEYLAGLKWDGVERLPTWMIDHMGAPDTPYHRRVGEISLVAAVRRARHPGCKFDECIVLESPEGRFKSSAIELMFGEEFFSDQPLIGESEQRQQEHLRGKWGYEIAEFAGFKKADREKTKAFLSRRTDRCRRVWGLTEFNQQRQAVFFTTTNETSYLESDSGNRRFWPVPVTKTIDIAKLAADRDQLWAEAAYKEARGASIRLEAEYWPYAMAEQEKRRVAHPWEDILANVEGEAFPSDQAGWHERRVFSSEIMTRHLKIPEGEQNKAKWSQAKDAMHKLGWEGPRDIRIGNRTAKGYVRLVEGPMLSKRESNPANDAALVPGYYVGHTGQPTSSAK